MLEIGKPSEERTILNDQINETKHADEAEALEGQVAEIAAKLDKMNKYVRNKGQKYKSGAVEMLTEANRLDQSHHDLRYWRAIQAGVPHHHAWLEEKKRRRATFHLLKHICLFSRGLKGSRFHYWNIEIATRSADASGQPPIKKLGLMSRGALNAWMKNKHRPSDVGCSVP